MTIRRKLVGLFVAAALFSPIGAGPVWAADTGVKIGVVNLQRCLNESTRGKKYKAQFTAEADRMKADLETEENALKALRQEIESQGMVLSETAKAEKEKIYKDRLDAFKKKFQATQKSLQTKDQELTRKILKDLQDVIRNLGETDGYTLILERQESGVLFAQQKTNITAEVIRRYEQITGGE